MSKSADIIDFTAHAERSLAAIREAGGDADRIARLEIAIAHGRRSESAPEVDPVAKANDIQFPLRSIPKWVPTES